MIDNLSQVQLQQIKQVLKEVLDEKMNWNIKEKLSNIEHNFEAYLKTSRSNLKTMRDFNTKHTSFKK